MAIRIGVISVEEVDHTKEILQRHRFRLPFKSFRELIEPPNAG
jgi:hypothetical protein